MLGTAPPVSQAPVLLGILLKYQEMLKDKMDSHVSVLQDSKEHFVKQVRMVFITREDARTPSS